MSKVIGGFWQASVLADWHTLQVDLASRSKYGKLIETDSGDFMVAEEPEIIVEAIRDVIREAEAQKKGLRE